MDYRRAILIIVLTVSFSWLWWGLDVFSRIRAIIRPVPERSLPADQFSHDCPVRAIAFAPDGTRLAATCQECDMTIWSVPRRTRICRLRGNDSPIRCVSFSPDGLMLASGAYDGIIRLWSTVNWELIGTFQIPFTSSITFSQGNDQLIALGQTALSVLRISDGTVVEKTKYGGFGAFAYARKRESFICSGIDGQLLFLNRNRLGTAPALVDAPTGRIMRVFLDQAEQQAFTVSYDEQILIWSVNEKSVTGTLPTARRRISCAAVSRDGAVLATGGEDGIAAVWHSARPLHNLKHSSALTSMEFTSDGKLLATGSNENTLTIWEVAAGARVDSFQASD